MNRNKNKNRYWLYCGWLILLLAACCTNSDRRQEKGFVLFIDPDYWYFVPATSMSQRNPLEALNSENLGYGIQFQPFFNGKRKVLARLDTIPMDDYDRHLTPYLWTLKIAPVEITYNVDSKRMPSASVFEFRRIIKGNELFFKFSTLSMEIVEVKPL